MGARGVPRGRDRVLADGDLLLFKQKIDSLKAEGLSLSKISERLGVPVSTIVHRLARLRKVCGKCEEAKKVL